MLKIKLLAEHQPSRCEICHQQDCFDTEHNYCSRCNSIYYLDKNPQRVITNSLKSPRVTNREYRTPEEPTLSSGEIKLFTLLLTAASIWFFKDAFHYSNLAMYEDINPVGLILNSFFCHASIIFIIYVQLTAWPIYVKDRWLLDRRIAQLILISLVSFILVVATGIYLESPKFIFYGSFLTLALGLWPILIEIEFFRSIEKAEK